MTQFDRKFKQAGSLRLALSNIQARQAKGLALSEADMNLLAEVEHRTNVRERMTLTSDGKVVVTQTANVDPVMAAMKDFSEFATTTNRKVANRKLIGAIDPVTAALWAKECNAGLGTAEFNAFAIKRIRDDSDYRKFRAGH